MTIEEQNAKLKEYLTLAICDLDMLTDEISRKPDCKHDCGNCKFSICAFEIKHGRWKYRKEAMQCILEKVND